MPQGGYGAYNAYISAATRYAALGAPTLYDHFGSYGSMLIFKVMRITQHSSLLYICNVNFANDVGGYFGPSRGIGRKIFVGRLPQEASAEDLRQYFGRFGRIIDVYVPKVITCVHIQIG